MREKELRLALVCYGGISLAVYMHGITKEVWKLTRASHGFHAGNANLLPSENIYLEILEQIADRCDVKLRVLTDIITGASAGGINGIFLAQAIAQGQSLEPLTQLWLEKADVDQLLDPNARPISRLTKFWAAPIAWFVGRQPGGTVETTVGAEAKAEVRAKLGRFVRARWFEPPFGGTEISTILLNAFQAMADQPPGPILLPPGQPLDLAVTVTDFNGHPETLRLNSPPEVKEQEHRLVIRFRHDPDQGESLGSAISLTFAGRATSSFPGAFPPLSIGEIDQLVRSTGLNWDDRDAFLASFLPKGMDAATRLSLIDGSVLANAPFRAAIDALPDRPARREVDRRFVFIDPKPGITAIQVPHGARKSSAPGFFTAILGSMSDLPREQPIRDNLDALHQRSIRIRRMQQIMDALEPEVESRIQSLFGHTFFLNTPTPKRVAAWRAKAQERAAMDAGYAYAGYAHLKLSTIIEGLADLANRAHQIDNDEADQFRAALWQEVRRQAIDQISTPASGKNAPTIRFLKDYDVSFRIRRLRFLARSVTQLVDQGDITDLAAQPVTKAIYAALGDFIDLQNAARFKPYPIENAAAFLNAVTADQNLTAKDDLVDAALSEALAKCPRTQRRKILLTYLGFPFFDIATLPMLQGEGLEEFNPIKVDRISPDDAQSIRSGGASATLKGIELNSFGAFFSRKYRENDYLWGRLHGAERLIDILCSTAPEYASKDEIAAFKRRIFEAILTEEEGRLTCIPSLFSEIRSEITNGVLAKATTKA